MNRTNIFFGESHSDWLPVRGGESGDFVFRRGDGHAFAKIAPASRRGELAGERDRLIWLKGRGVACPEVINWQEEQEGACLVITAIPGVPAADLSGADLLKAWPSMGQQLGAVHSLSVDQCPFERRLSRMFGRAVDVVSRNAVNPDFLPDEDKSTPQLDLLARVERELTGGVIYFASEDWEQKNGRNPLMTGITAISLSGNRGALFFQKLVKNGQNFGAEWSGSG